jgi:hypothetical protein
VEVGFRSERESNEIVKWGSEGGDREVLGSGRTSNELFERPRNDVLLHFAFGRYCTCATHINVYMQYLLILYTALKILPYVLRSCQVEEETFS